MNKPRFIPLAAVTLLAALVLSGCHTAAKPPVARTATSAQVQVPPTPPPPAPFAHPVRHPPSHLHGDEIIVAGQAFHTGTRVVTWYEARGYNGYSTELRPLPARPDAHGKVPIAKPVGITYGQRNDVLPPAEMEHVRHDGWTVPTLQRAVDQFVLHYDVAGFSRECFDVLHYQRGLSVHFMLDLDGTIYQTIDLEDAAFHATIANNRSIGIEIANIGAYPLGERKSLAEWYHADSRSRVHIEVPQKFGDPGFLRWHFTAKPARTEPIRGMIQDKDLIQYDFTPEQYAALIKLTAALCRVFPRITCDYPHEPSGHVVTHKLPDPVLANYHGILGHFHIQTNKTDPGPALQWDRIIEGARALLNK